MTKTEHIHIRCSHAAKEYTQRRLKAIGAGYTLSGILDRLSSGWGLVSAGDADVIRRLKRLLVRLRHINLHAVGGIADEFRDLRTVLGHEIERLERGTRPVYLYEEPCFNRVGGHKHAYVLLQYFYDEVPDASPACISNDLYKRWTAPGFQQDFLESGLNISMSCIYSIRREYTDRPSFGAGCGPGTQLMDAGQYSRDVRGYLDFLHDIPRLTDMEYEMLLSSLDEEIGLLAQFVAHPSGDVSASVRQYADCISAIVGSMTKQQPETG